MTTNMDLHDYMVYMELHASLPLKLKEFFNPGESGVSGRKFNLRAKVELEDLF